jgi:hypothetical protein
MPNDPIPICVWCSKLYIYATLATNFTKPECELLCLLQLKVFNWHTNCSCNDVILLSLQNDADAMQSKLS